jgi:hypothetical protein
MCRVIIGFAHNKQALQGIQQEVSVKEEHALVCQRDMHACEALRPNGYIYLRRIYLW